MGYPEKMVREEARRCLRCDICLRCGKCVEVCRDKMGINALQMGYFDFDHPVATDFRVTEDRCILCGACATNCPTGAMQMEDRDGERILALCGTILNRKNCWIAKVVGPCWDRHNTSILFRNEPMQSPGLQMIAAYVMHAPGNHLPNTVSTLHR